MLKLGIENLIEENRVLISGLRVGILAHAASINTKNAHAIDLISNSGLCEVTALFGPEHGLMTRAEDMEAVSHAKDTASGVSIYSLYGATLDSLKPTKEMLEKMDVLVVDIQDIGSRYYTYVWTTCLCMEACAEAGKKIIVCDRPNPIGGTIVEGGGIDEGYESFVGLHSIPVRHGMTIGEIARLVNEREKIGANLEVVKMDGWKREMNWPDTGIPWTNPSPNMRSYTAALLYPGMCLLEATNFSEGRGTDTPFEIVGAPYVDSDEIIGEFEKLNLPGIKAAPTSFIPTFQKWHGRLCNGIRWVVTDAKTFRPYLTGLAFVGLIYRLYKGRGLEWRSEPYEFVTNRPAIDLLTGYAFFREKVEVLSMQDIARLSTESKQLIDDRKKHLLYK